MVLFENCAVLTLQSSLGYPYCRFIDALAASRCLDWLEKASTGNRVLDYGSGSGILGLAALKFGATEVRLT